MRHNPCVPSRSSLVVNDVPRPFSIRLVDWLVYVAVRVAICVVQALPLSTCEWIARSSSNLLANRLRIRREVVRDNLCKAFPEWSPEQHREAARAMWEHLLLMVFEIAHAPRVIHKTTWRKHLRIHDMELMVRTLWLDRPKVVLSGHYGNFELAAYLLGAFGLKIFSVARELDNPLLDRFVNTFRESRGQEILPKKGSAPDVAIAMEQNGAIGLLGDQAAGPRGCWVEFLGRPASVHKAIGVFALSASAPVMVCTATRRTRMFDFDLRVEGIIDPAVECPETSGLVPLSQWYTSLLEQAIRREPAQYWWVHRRWRGSRRRGRVARSAA
jgi:KDO2-lipid IV(A) lauroyltransferase